MSSPEEGSLAPASSSGACPRHGTGEEYLPPLPVYVALQKRGPIFKADGMDHTWVVVGYPEVQQILKDRRFANAPTVAYLPDAAGRKMALAYEPLRRWFMFQDGAAHRHLRQMVSAHFTTEAVERMRPFVEATAKELVAAAADEIDVIDELAQPLVGQALCRLLGMPTSIIPHLYEWSSKIDSCLIRTQIAENVQVGIEALTWLSDIGLEQIAAGPPRGSVLETLAQAYESGQLDEDDLRGTISLLVYAGFSTTTNFIGNAVLATTASGLLDDIASGQLQVEQVIDELLRFNSSVPRVAHFATEPMEIAGCAIEPGDMMVLVLGAANHDPDTYECPQAIRPERDEGRSLTFGLGPHYCLGWRYARLEATAALTELAGRWPGAGAQMLDERRLQRGLKVISQMKMPLKPLTTTQSLLPLSAAQEQMWLLHRFYPSDMYNSFVCHRFKGPLDVEALDWSLQELVRRHSTLRTAFVEVEGRPYRRITDGGIELRQSAAADEAELERLLAAEAVTSFDLTEAPLVRALLLKRGDEHVLALTFHHIATDGWSDMIIMRELSELYNSRLEQRAARLPELEADYDDYVVWQAEQEGLFERQLEFWRGALADVPTVELALDHPRPPLMSSRGAAERLRLSKDLSHRLVEIGQSARATPSMVFLAAFQLLLARYSGQNDVVVGTPTAGRNRVDFESLVGLFINTIVLRLNLSGDPSFVELIQRSRNFALDAYDNQQVPFSRVVSEVNPTRSLATTPLFQHLCAFQSIASSPLTFTGLEAERLPTLFTPAQMDLALNIIPAEEEFSLILIYALDLFEASTAKRMLSDFETLLERVAADPTAPLSSLELPSPAVGALVPDEADLMASQPAPASLEERMRAIWAELLDDAEIGPDDDFFEIGGDSLQVPRLVARAVSDIGARLEPRDVFENRTVASLARLCEQRLQETAEIATGDDKAEETSVVVPLSFAQERLYFLNELAPEHTHNVPLAYRIQGPFEPELLQESLEHLVARHASLRTRFSLVNGVPQQTILENARIELEVQVMEGQNELEVVGAVSEHCGRLFDLEHDSPLRALVVRCGPEEHVLVLTAHHLVIDAWSLVILATEMSQVYAALLEGREPGLPEIEGSYVAYAAAQREKWESGGMTDSLDYWLKQLADVPLLDLPTDRPRRRQLDYGGVASRFQLAPELGRAAKQLAQAEGVSPFMFYLASLAALLMRQSRQTDFTIGSPVTDRLEWNLDGVVGFFVNLIVLRSDLSGDPTFRELLTLTRDVCLQAYAHHELPFELLVSKLHPERDMSHSLLTQVLLNYHDQPDTHLELPGATVTKFELDYDQIIPAAHFDLVLTLSAQADGSLECLLHGRADLFDRETLIGFSSQLRALIAGAVADPSQRLSELPLLVSEEGRSAPVPALPAPDLLESFRQWVTETPEGRALSSGSQSWTYVELDQQSDRLAAALAARGVGPEAVVVTHSGRAPELALAFLGILKAGGVFAPIDDSQPPERLRTIVADAEPRLVLTMGSRAVADELSEVLSQQGVAAVSIGDLLAEGGKSPSPSLSEDNLAYLIYTSGSTGAPKGVALSRRALAEATCGLTELLGLGPGDSHLLLAASFDIAVTQIGIVLAGGATLLCDETLSPLEFLSSAPLTTTLSATPSMLDQIEDRFEGLHTILVGGEECLDSIADRWGQGRRFLNGYGPTEAALMVSAGERQASGAPPIGKPFGSTRAYVLDQAMAVLPDGIPGELYLGGPQVARGYVGSPALTAARFVPDPFSGQPGARLYRTGDLVRRRPADGQLEFYGRTDRQVKIRGFRVELGEVESALASFTEVRASAVVVQQENGRHRLTAYLVPQEGYSEAALRDYLRGRLPDYMVPTAFVQLDKLPLKPNGKIDEGSLPAADTARPELSQPYVAPRDAVEEALVDAWRITLGVDRVGIYDSFFDLGGDSLLSLRLLAALKSAGFRPRLAQVFEHPTPASLAAALTTDSPRSGLAADDEDAPLTVSQAEFLRQLAPLLPDASYANIGGLFAPATLLDADTLTAALEHVVAHHQALRTQLVLGEQGWGQRFLAPDSHPWLQQFDLCSHDDAENAWRQVVIDMQKSLRLEGPLFQAGLIALPDSQILVLVLHHLIGDLLSFGVLVEDLERAYLALQQGQAPLLEQTIPLAQWAREQAQLAASGRAEDDLRAVRALSDSNLDLSDDDFGLLGNRQVTSEHLDAAVLARLQKSCAANGVALSDLLLAALVRTVCSWRQRPGLIVRQISAGRDLRADLDLSRTIGWLTLPSFLPLEDDDDFSRLPARVNAARQALPWAGRGAGMAWLLDQEPPVADVNFNFLGEAPHPSRARPGSLLSPLPSFWVPWRDPAEPRLGLLDLAVEVDDGLGFQIAHGPTLGRATGMRLLAELIRLIEGWDGR